MENLKGKVKYCASTSVLAGIIGFVLVIVLAPFTGGASLTLLDVVAIALSAASVAVDVMVIQPGITDMWNKITGETMTMTDQFLEQGISTALQSAVTDVDLVPDLYDQDLDQKWGWDGATSKPKDEISRFAYYYSLRIKSIIAPESAPILDFLDALDDFVHSQRLFGPNAGTTDDGGWALSDPVLCSAPPLATDHDCCQATKPSLCNPCCLPLNERPDCCDAAADPCGSSATCYDDAISPYTNSETFKTYKWVYRPNTQDETNATYSFLELLGEDDANESFYKTAAATVHQLYEAVPLIPFKYSDATGVFPALHKMKFWGFDLQTATVPTNESRGYWLDMGCTMAGLPLELQLPCLNFDYPYGGFGDIIATGKAIHNINTYVDSIADNVPGNPSLASDQIRVDNSDRIFADTMECAEQALPSDYSFWQDNLDTELNNGSTGFWKEGTDAFCNSGDIPAAAWPYTDSCPREGTSYCEDTFPVYDENGDEILAETTTEQVPCACGDTGTDPTLWHDDILDGWSRLMSEFLTWSETLLNLERSRAVVDFKTWYGGAAKWLEPRVETMSDIFDYYSESADQCVATDASGNPINAQVGPCCYDCGEFTYDAAGNRSLLMSRAPYHGLIQEWVEQLAYVRRRLEDFRNKSFAGTTCTDVWCVPPTMDGGVQCMNTAVNTQRLIEDATFDSNVTGPNGVRGDIEDIIHCLEWNISDASGLPAAAPAGFPGPVADYKGNFAKFWTCLNECATSTFPATHCVNLPRSLVPGFDDRIYADPGPEFNSITACLASPTETDCTTLCDPFVNFPSQAALRTLWEPPHTDCDPGFCSCSAWLGTQGDTNGFHAAVLARRNAIVATGSPNPAELAALNGCLAQTTLAGCELECEPGTAAGLLTTVAYPAWLTPTHDPGSCAWVGSPTPDIYAYYNALLAALADQNGSCQDPAYVADLRQSMYEAMVQARKFDQRRIFLTNRLAELDQAILAVKTAEENFKEFYENPVQDIIKYRMSLEDEEGGLPSEVIYGWQSTSKDRSKTGPWHVVRVDAHTPGRCDSCDPNQERPQPYPSIKTKTHNMGTKRCFYLVNYVGTVKVRVTRFDEEKNVTGRLLFPNGIRIWDFRSFHPERGTVDTTGIGGTCRHVVAQNPGGVWAPPAAYLDSLPMEKYVPNDAGTALEKRIYGGAFIMNKMIPNALPSGAPDPLGNEDCWKRMTQILTRGVTTETCAKYYWGGNSRRMQVKFVPCKSW